MNMADFLRRKTHDLPRSFEEIITEHNHKLKVELASVDDPAIKKLPLKLLNYQGTMLDAFFYKRTFPTLNKEQIYMVGLLQNGEECHLWHTSQVRVFDEERKIVLTESGAHYVINNFDFDNIDPYFINHICTVLDDEGYGGYFGIPDFWCRT